MKLSDEIEQIVWAFDKNDDRRGDVRMLASRVRVMEVELDELRDPTVMLRDPGAKRELVRQLRRLEAKPGRIEVMQDDLGPRLRALVSALRSLAAHNKRLGENPEQPYYLGLARGLEQAALDICEIMCIEGSAGDE